MRSAFRLLTLSGIGIAAGVKGETGVDVRKWRAATLFEREGFIYECLRGD